MVANDKTVKERLKKGWLRAIVTFEVVGRPEKHVVDALDQYLANIAKEEARILIVEEAREDPVKHDDGMFSTFAEVELLGKDLDTFTWLCLNFSPASIEIMEPEQVEIDSQDMTNWLNDLLSKIHEIGSDYRNQKGAKEHLTIAMNALIQNAILLSVRNGEKKAEAIGKDVGIVPEQLKPFLDNLVEKGKMSLSGTTYGMPDPAAKVAPVKKKK